MTDWYTECWWAGCSRKRLHQGSHFCDEHFKDYTPKETEDDDRQRRPGE